MLLFYIMLPFVGLSAQDTAKTTTTAILATAIEDSNYNYHTDQVDYIDENTYSLSYIDHLELRTRTRNFDLNEQSYRFRAYTNFPKERKLNDKYKAKSLDEGRLQGKEKLNNALEYRYKLIISMIKNEEVLQGKLKLKELLEDRITILKKLANNLDFDYQDLLDAENDYHKLQIDLVDLENNMIQSSREVSELLGVKEKVRLDKEGIISVEGIALFVNSFDKEIAEDNLYYAQQSLDVELAELEYEQKKASAKTPLKFLEASYRDDFNEGFRKDFSLGLGLKIPVGSAVKGSLNERVIKIAKEKNNLDDIKYELEEDISETLTVLEVLFAKHRLLSQILEESNEEESLKKYQAIEGISPLVLLKVKENMIKKRQILLDMEKQIFSTYLKFLDLNGLLVRSPVVNYLSSKSDLVF
ncbi:hypothetical protein [Algoriphagus sp. NG3]|uniref:hypothetical protein n=1 Tax=Algoriphagus sp. NG3 TaxID=3097546 RepID=UPI002A7FC101|nr:hypothetical protein [Algoriphagus sp. NG3]WPR75601.1 hypothetical protein SLW71_23380 [Algoriphagus sp. NG3]